VNKGDRSWITFLDQISRFDPVRSAWLIARGRCGLSESSLVRSAQRRSAANQKHLLDAPFFLRDDEGGIRGVAVGGSLPVNLRRSPWRSGIELYGTREQ